MAKREIYDCDRCGKKDVAARMLHVPLDRYTDAAGQGCSEYDNTDLCFDCAMTLLRKLLSVMPIPNVKNFLNENIHERILRINN